MKAEQTAPKNIDEYIAAFPEEVQKLLEEIRMTIRQAAPDAKETISYQIPAFVLNSRYLIYFAAFKKHIGLYPAPIENPEFKEKLAVYAAGKGTARFPLDKPFPFDLISNIVKFKAKEHVARAEGRGRKK